MDELKSPQFARTIYLLGAIVSVGEALVTIFKTDFAQTAEKWLLFSGLMLVTMAAIGLSKNKSWGAYLLLLTGLAYAMLLTLINERSFVYFFWHYLLLFFYTILLLIPFMIQKYRQITGPPGHLGNPLNKG